MIPKIAHYVWLGKGKKPDNFDICLKSWHEFLNKDSGWEIIEWTEENLPTDKFPLYYHKAIAEKRWAFASDVARTWIILNHGGVYLDTDMLLLKNIDNLLKYDFFSGYEDEKNIACGLYGATKDNIIIRQMYEWYEKNVEIKAIPIIMTEVISKLKEENRLSENIFLSEKDVFYSYPKDRPCDPLDWKYPDVALAIHLWDYSWQSDTKRNLKKLPGFKKVKNLLSKLGVLEKVKKLLKQV